MDVDFRFEELLLLAGQKVGKEGKAFPTFVNLPGYE